MRCDKCGNKITDGHEECPTCNEPLWALGPTAGDMSAPLTVSVQGDSNIAASNRRRQELTLPPSRGQMALQQAGFAAAIAASAAQSALAYVIPAKRSVYGRVIISEAAGSEDPDMDACKIITRILWIIMLLPFLIGAALVCLLFRRFAPINLFAMLGVFRFLNPAAQNTMQVPVRYYRIRDGSDAEVMVRMKGQFTHGNIGQEDIVTLWGRSRGGTLYATHGYNHRTSSTIRLKRSYSWVGLLLTLLFILFLMAKCHAIGGAR